MPYYPIFVDLGGQKVLVVGGGKVAQRKIDILLECGASVNIISKKMTRVLQGYIQEEKVRFHGHEFNEDALQGAFLVIAATDDPILNSRIGTLAKDKGILVNVVDQPNDCNFIVPSLIKRGDLLIAVSTSGKSPALAKKIRETLSDQFGTEHERFLILMGRLRKDILVKGFSQKKKSRIFHALVDSPILEAIARKNWGEVASTLNEILGIQVSPQDVLDYIKGE
jgi:precorrin-2 dehydrogenase/sirohydrochlorin ferrochelatase